MTAASRALAHSFAGIANRMMMSKEYRLFIYVEGRDVDPTFYDNIARAALEDEYNAIVVPIETVDKTGTGGKPRLLALYDWLRRRRVLNQKNSAGRRSAMFALDGDFDFVLDKRRRSPHIIYTTMYNVEAEVFAHADLTRALGALTSLTHADCEQIGRDLGDWIGALADTWKDWSALCILAVGLGAHSDITPRRPSVVQMRSAYGPADKRAIVNARRRVLRHAHCQDAKTVTADLRPKIRAVITDQATRRRLVNGKHIAAYLSDRVRTHPIGVRERIKRVDQTALPAFLACLDYQAAWAAPYRTAMRRLAARV